MNFVNLAIVFISTVPLHSFIVRERDLLSLITTRSTLLLCVQATLSAPLFLPPQVTYHWPAYFSAFLFLVIFLQVSEDFAARSTQLLLLSVVSKRYNIESFFLTKINHCQIKLLSPEPSDDHFIGNYNKITIESML